VLLPPLPVGRLHDRTLRLIAVAGRVHVRSGPWIPLEEDESRVVRITGVDDLLFGRPASADEEPERRRRSEARRAIRQVVGGGRTRKRRRTRVR
jgi:hypothetical protein